MTACVNIAARAAVSDLLDYLAGILKALRQLSVLRRKRGTAVVPLLSQDTPTVVCAFAHAPFLLTH